MAKRTILIFVFGISVLLLSRCANQLPPGGGEIDTIPPQVFEINPPNGTTNYHDNYFEISFTEYVAKRSVQDAIFISPPMQKGLEYDWSGKSLTVNFKDTLKENTTYTVTIGADVQDINNGNKMTEPVTFTFSTGAKIDSGKIAGKIYDNNPTGVMVYAYKLNGKEVDPTQQKPDYTSQVGKNGKYYLLGLGNGQYNVFAFRDKFRDFKYQRNDDECGVPFKNIILSDTVNNIDDVDFFLSLEDTIPPQITSVKMTDRNHFLIEFNEPIDTTKILASNFYLYDSTQQKQINPKYFYKGNGRANQFYLSISDSLISGNRNYLFGDKIIDKSQNRSGLQENSITVNDDRDTSAPKLLKTFGSIPGDKYDYDIPIISMKFDDGFDHSKLKQSIEISDSKGKDFPFDIITRDDSWFEIKVLQKLKPLTEYNLKLNLVNIVDAAGNKVDSVYKTKFTTVNDLDFSGVSGTVENVGNIKRVYVVLESANNDKNLYKQKIDAKKNFNIAKVVPGKYLIWSFKDRNENSMYDYGNV